MLISSSVEETQKIGEKIGKTLKGKEILALFGGLGAGKTALTRGIVDILGAKDQTSSPTFAIMNEYNGEKGKIFHFDMYRINGEEDLESTGFYDCIGKGIIIIEWSENILGLIPNSAVKILLEPGENENERKIKIEGVKI